MFYIKKFILNYTKIFTESWKEINFLFCIYSSRPGRPPKRASSVGLSLAASASHLSHQLKKHRLENGDYVAGVYENGHLQGNFIG